MSPRPHPSERLQRDLAEAEDGPPPPAPDRTAGVTPAPEPGAAPAPEPGVSQEPESGATPLPRPDAAPAAKAERPEGGEPGETATGTPGDTTGKATKTAKVTKVTKVTDDAAGRPPKGTGTWRGRVAGALAAMLFAATATVAVLQWQAADRLAEEKAERAAVSARAGEFAVALQTYDHGDLQTYRDRVFAISGEDFEKTYDEAFSPLEGVITSMRASSSASVRGVYVSDVAEGRAKAVTVVDSQVTSTAGTRRMLGTYMELALIKTEGRWKVNAATVMGAAEELITDPDGDPVEPSSSPSPSGKKSD